MAQSIIDALFYGKILPHEQVGVSGDKEYDEVNRNIRDEKEYWGGKLTEQDRQRLEVLETLYSQAFTIQNVEAFRYGFRLGILIMTEIYTGKDPLAGKDKPPDKQE